jgi:hypothetical protein
MLEEIIDPFNYFTYHHYMPNVIDLILQHLRFKDLLNVSAVHREYEPIIMNKVKFKVNKENDLLESGGELFRKYPHVKFEHELASFGFLRRVLNENLKTIEVDDCYIDWEQEATFEKDIEDLFGNPKNRNLESVEKIDIKSSASIYKLICSILKYSKNLKDLSITEVSNEKDFLNDLSNPEYEFQLNRLSFSVLTEYNFEMPKPEIFNLIQRHSDTLTELILDLWVDDDVINLVLSLKNLKRFELYEMGKWNRDTKNFKDWTKAQFITNESIKTLKIQDFNNDINFLKCMLIACPNLKYLIVTNFTQSIIQLVKSLKNRNTKLFVCDEYHVSNHNPWVRL